MRCCRCLGVLLAPVTVIFGPGASYNVLSIALPGLLCYAAYRVARLWLPSQPGAIAAGAFFGLSSMLVWRSWYHLNLAAGELFIPFALEAAVRLTRRPGWRQAVILGAVLAAAVLTDQEIAVLVLIVTALALLTWLLRPPFTVAKLRATALAAVVTVVLASPQLAAIVQQVKSGGATSPPVTLAKAYIKYSARLPGIVAPSPQISHFGLGGLGFIYSGPTNDGIPSFGLVLTVLALLGVLAGWRRRSTWLLALLWLGCAALALGPVLRVGGHIYAPAPEVLGGRNLSRLMPFTWFARLPGLSGFREPDRMMMLGILPAALLAGAAVDWLRYHFAPAIVALAALGVLEAGWSGNPGIGTMPTALPAADRAIAADHSGSIVVNVPFGIRGGTYGYGLGFDPRGAGAGHRRRPPPVGRLHIPGTAADDQRDQAAHVLRPARRPAVWRAQHPGRTGRGPGRRAPDACRLGAGLELARRQPGRPALPACGRFPLRLPGRWCLGLPPQQLTSQREVRLRRGCAGASGVASAVWPAPRAA